VAHAGCVLTYHFYFREEKLSWECTSSQRNYPCFVRPKGSILSS